MKLTYSLSNFKENPPNKTKGGVSEEKGGLKADGRGKRAESGG